MEREQKNKPSFSFRQIFAISLIEEKKKKFFSKKPEENISEPKELWKNFKKLGLPKTKTPSANICLKKMTVCFSVLFPFLTTLKNFFQILYKT